MVRNVRKASWSDSWIKWCETRTDCTNESDLFVISLDADSLINLGRWLKSFFAAREHTNFWHPSGYENIEFWEAGLPYQSPSANIRVRGIIGGQIERLGPSYVEITSSSHYTKLWKAALIEHFANMQVLKRRRGQTERLLDMLAESAYSSRIWNIIPLRENRELYHGDEVHSPLIFLGSNAMTGLVPPGARVGDKIVQFWNSSASAVVREESKGKYELIGRAGVIKDRESDDWDVPLDQSLFGVNSSSAVEVEMDIMTLTKLTLDTVDLPSDAEIYSSKDSHIELYV